MELTQRQKEIQNSVAHAFNKASEDVDFRAGLTKAPVEVIGSLVGYKLTEQEVLETINQDFVYGNNMRDLELSDNQLELVSGGEISPQEFVDWIKSFF